MSTIEELLALAVSFEARARLLQDESGPDDDAGLAEEYQAWLAECLAILDDDLRQRHRGEYEGTTWSPKIRAFLEAPRQRSMLYDLAEPDRRLPGLSGWQHPVEKSFIAPLRAQRQLLREHDARRASSTGAPPHDIVVAAFRRFPRFIRPLLERRRAGPVLQIRNEYDVQDAVEAILSVLFDDVRPEEATPSHAAGSAAIDFLVPEARLAIEVKMTRPSLRPRTIVDELTADIERYRRHPEVECMIAFIYDPIGSIRNRTGFEHDLERTGGPLLVRVVIVG